MYNCIYYSYSVTRTDLGLWGLWGPRHHSFWAIYRLHHKFLPLTGSTVPGSTVVDDTDCRSSNLATQRTRNPLLSIVLTTLAMLMLMSMSIYIAHNRETSNALCIRCEQNVFRCCLNVSLPMDSSRM